MGLVKTRRLARHSLRSACSRPYGLRTPARGGYAMQKQQRAKATVVRQCAKFGTPSMKKGGPRDARPQQFCVNNIVK